ncbi:MAG: hypothetical protein BWX84_02149 [Verrucomicrobia bacterium ADurb.Bin118]|nr:MAG: hypothetical protein BWX84_02149 [Verrucomicrobia bacterium ADurb.Bin118]
MSQRPFLPVHNDEKTTRLQIEPQPFQHGLGLREMMKNPVHVHQVRKAIRQPRILTLPQHRNDLGKTVLGCHFQNLGEFGGVNFLGQHRPARAHDIGKDQSVRAVAATDIGNDRARANAQSLAYGL